MTGIRLSSLVYVLVGGALLLGAFVLLVHLTFPTSGMAG